MISQFFILSPRGDTIIARDYLGNVPKVRSCPSLIPFACSVLLSFGTLSIEHDFLILVLLFGREAQKSSSGKLGFGMREVKMHHLCLLSTESTIFTPRYRALPRLRFPALLHLTILAISYHQVQFGDQSYAQWSSLIDNVIAKYLRA